MGIRVKYFIVDANDNLKNISKTKMNKLINQDQNTNFFEFAGKRMRYVTVVFEYKNREPISIESIKGCFLKLDKDGKLDVVEFDKQKQIALEMLSITNKNIISAEERYKRTYTWEITPQIEEQIYNKIFKINKLKK